MLTSVKFAKTSLSLTLIALMAVAVAAERGDDSERKSKNGRAEGSIGGVSVVVEYGRPSARDRTIFGGLVPYGEVWRTGADEATTITFGADVLVEGTSVPAGTYALFTVPGESEWSVIFNSAAEQWGAFDHDSDQDVASITVNSQVTDLVETFTMTVGDDGVTMAWADRSVSFGVAAGS